jgi:positive regulator of sigma E activity
MIFHPAILALFLGSILVSFMILYAAFHAFQVLRKWDLRSGSELQLTLERKTYLISTLIAYVFGFELLSFFLFIFTADQIHSFFIGAMCAAGSLFVNPYGYPTLVLKLFNFILAGIWLILNYVDNKAEDYPLIKKKYIFFLLFAPLILIETALQVNYFIRLKPNIITSCCGTLFSSQNGILPLTKAFSPGSPAMAAFYITLALTIGVGIAYFLKGKMGYLFSGLSSLFFILSIISIFSFISFYIYELPTHRCPFCMLQSEYGFIGYPLYLTLLGGVISGTGVGMLMPFRKIRSLSDIIPSVQRSLALITVILFLIFSGIVTVRILLSDLILEGF